MELGPWSVDHALALLRLAIAELQGSEEAQEVSHVVLLLEREPHAKYSQLLAHPLFLQMTLDLIVDGHKSLIREPAILIERWMVKKIERDLLAPRIQETPGFSVDDYVFGMIEAMRQIASDTTSDESSEIFYDDEIQLDEALTVARQHTGVGNLDAATFLSTSLFIPVNIKRGRTKTIRFFHRSIQEHLANYVPSS